MDAEENKKGHHSDQKFAEVMAQKTDAVSEFAKKKSFREQRQYLPIFAVRNEVPVSRQFFDWNLALILFLYICALCIASVLSIGCQNGNPVCRCSIQ